MILLILLGLLFMGWVMSGFLKEQEEYMDEMMDKETNKTINVNNTYNGQGMEINENLNLPEGNVVDIQAGEK